MRTRLTTEQFIEKARDVHGDKYDYSQVVYEQARVKVSIVCPRHGMFLKKPLEHLAGGGCPRCTKFGKKDTQWFIERATEIHGDKYDYSKTIYTGSDNKLEIMCPIHGSFWQTARGHFFEGGCRKCGAGMCSVEQFCQKASEIHGDKYDYSKVSFYSLKEKAIIICPKHGEFLQQLQSHLSGCGCAKCAGKHIPSTQEFIEQAREVHGDRYDYSRVSYTSAKDKVEILCSEHGAFLQTPDIHLHGSGCPVCGGRCAYTVDRFLKKAQEVHGSKYGYSNIANISPYTNVSILCPIHGEFPQNIYRHLGGAGCPRCSGVYSYTTEEFIELAQKIYGDRYDYSRAVYVNAKHKVEIICKKHGVFLCSPDNHLRGKSCPRCAESHGERAVGEYLGKVGLEFIGQKTFPDCIYKRPLKFDFYIPSLGLFIEYHGIQHYEYSPYFYKNQKQWDESRERDRIKKEYAMSHGTYLEIRYDENIEQILEKVLGGINE